MDERLAALSYLSAAKGKKLVVFPRHLRNVVEVLRNDPSRFFPEGNAEFVELEVGRGGNLFDGLGGRFFHDDHDIIFFLDDLQIPLAKVKKALKRNGLIFDHAYLAVPGFNNPRWIFPDNQVLIQKCGKIVKPSKPKSILAWKLFRFLNHFGMGRMLFPARIVVARRGSGQGVLHRFITRFWERDDLDFIIYTGAYGYSQKFTVQVMDRAGGIVAYGKIGHTVQSRARIEQEYKILLQLGEMKFESMRVPQALHLGRLHQGEDIIMLQSPPGAACRWESELTTLHINALVELYQQTFDGTKSGPVILEQLSGSISRLNRSLLPSGLAKVPEVLQEAVSLLGRKISGYQIPLALTHGDFSPWNIFISDAHIFIFDWEIAELRPPLWDIYNFIFHSELNIHSRKPQEVFSMMAGRVPKYAGLINRYVEQTRKDPTYASGIFLLLFLCDICIWYIHYLTTQIEAGFDQERGETEYIRAAVEMIRLMISNNDLLANDSERKSY